MVTLTGRNGLTVIITIFDTAGFPYVQVPLEVSTTLILFALTGINVYVWLVAPEMSIPLTFHWYAGFGPPLTGIAV